MESSDLRYANSGDVHVAYRVFGEGPPDLVFAMGMDFPSVEFHDHAAGPDFHELTSRMRVIRFDKRGTGASDRVSGAPSLEERMDDVRAVMDAVGAERAALLWHVDGAAMAILSAATHPERVFALVLFQGKPRFVRAPDFPWAPTREEYEQRTQAWLAELLDTGQLERAFATRLQRPPSDPVVRERARATRLTISPASLLALRRMNMDIDVRNALSTIQVPTLIVHRSADSTTRATPPRPRPHTIWRGGSPTAVCSRSADSTGCRTRRSQTSSSPPGSDASSSADACSRPCCLPTSSTRPRKRPSSVRNGRRSSPSTMRRSGAS